MSKKWLGALVALGMMGAGAAPAAAQGVTVPGCYGVVLAACNPTVSGVEMYEGTVPVCVSTCTYVPVSTPGMYGDGLCASFTWLHSGNTFGECVRTDG